MEARGWDSCDFVLISGDAYVDHPSFGAALIGRLLEDEGFRVGIIAQPNWQDIEAFKTFGRPRLSFLITSGNMDSMVNHYTANGKPRSEEAYSPGGVPGRRPDRALIVYSGAARQAYRGVPIVIGGIEASLRRIAHYDYWSNTLRRSVLIDSKADLLVYGMAEKSMVKLARRLAAGEEARGIRDLRGTVFRLTGKELQDLSPEEISARRLPSFEQMREDPRLFAEGFALWMRNADPFSAAPLFQQHGEQGIVQNPPEYPLSQQELDRVYQLPYTRRAHPSYRQEIPALQEVRFSLVSHRGCFGGCSFCALAFHQGRIVQSRSHESLLREALELTRDEDFKGYIHDVGGPTANFRRPACDRQKTKGACVERQCLFPSPCPRLKPDHADYLRLLREIRALPGIKKVFVRSGLRFDYLLLDGSGTGQEFFRELCEHHVSGQLKVAPEHVSDRVLGFLGKPSEAVYRDFSRAFSRINKELGKKQYLIPYFISAHPGSRLEDAVELAEYCRDSGFIPDQVQDFYPTPGTVSTCMYYTGLDPRTMNKVYVPRGGRERRMQRALLQFNRRENRRIVREALVKAGRRDLIGYGRKCLVRPQKNRLN